MHLIVGLGNPGAKYAGTRHNAGWFVIDELARRSGLLVARREHEAMTGSGFFGENKVMLVKPQTFMNLSGRAVTALMRYHKVEPANVLVICDDLNLPVGKIRLRAGGSDGGQNGLKSISQSLGGQPFPRLRFGIGEPPREVRMERGTADYVLSPFATVEKPLVNETVTRAADCVETWVKSGIEAAMTGYN